MLKYHWVTKYLELNINSRDFNANKARSRLKYERKYFDSCLEMSVVSINSTIRMTVINREGKYQSS